MTQDLRKIVLPLIDLADDTASSDSRSGTRTVSRPSDHGAAGSKRTMIAVYPKGHGRGAVVLKRCHDAGLVV